MMDAMTAATWFIWQNNSQKQQFESEEYGLYEGISSTKLQNLLFYAQGLNLAIYNRVLFQEKIMAWKQGPIVQNVYDAFIKYKNSPVSAPINEENAKAIRNIAANDYHILSLTYDCFAIYTSWHLCEMVHASGSPWDTTIKRDGLNSEISCHLIKEYFSKNVVDRNAGD